MNKSDYLGISMLELRKIMMYEFWYAYGKPKYGEKSKFCLINFDRYIVYIKAGAICKDISEDVENIFDTSNYDLDRPLPKK